MKPDPQPESRPGLPPNKGTNADGLTQDADDEGGKPLTVPHFADREEIPGLGLRPERIAMQRAAVRMRNIARSMLEMLDQSMWGDAVADLEWHSEQLDPTEDADTGTADDRIDDLVVAAIRKALRISDE